METTSPARSTADLVTAANALCEAPRQLSAHMPAPLIETWLKARGWVQGDRRWTAPDGTRIWQTDEAFQLQLIAEMAFEPCGACGSTGGTHTPDNCPAS